MIKETSLCNGWRPGQKTSTNQNVELSNLILTANIYSTTPTPKTYYSDHWKKGGGKIGGARDTGS